MYTLLTSHRWTYTVGYYLLLIPKANSRLLQLVELVVSSMSFYKKNRATVTWIVSVCYSSLYMKPVSTALLLKIQILVELASLVVYMTTYNLYEGGNKHALQIYHSLLNNTKKKNMNQSKKKIIIIMLK